MCIRDRVDIYGLSFGGQCGASYLYYYGEKAKVHKACLNVPAIGDVYKRQLLAPGRAQSTFILPAPKGRRCESAFALLSHQKVTKRL